MLKRLAVGQPVERILARLVSDQLGAAPINGLTPGVIYAIQVRAFGQLGHTEWTDSATRMCI